MSKEHAYAYEAGYMDGSVHYELEHCPACKNVADLQEALSENAKLREQVADACMQLGGAWVRCTELRELVRDMWTYITEPVSKRNNLKERLARLDDIGDRMRELGVEVDE